MIKEKAFLGYPIPFKDICSIVPPKIKDVVQLDSLYSYYYSLITFSELDLKEANAKLEELGQETHKTPLSFLLEQVKRDNNFKLILEESFFCFIKEPVLLLPDLGQIVIGNLEELKELSEVRLLNEENFFDFQNLVRVATGNKEEEPLSLEEDSRVLKLKLRFKERERLLTKKGKGISLLTTMCALCLMRIGVTPFNIDELSYAAVNYLTKMYQGQEEYDLAVKSLLAGADSKKVKPVYWIKNFKEE